MACDWIIATPSAVLGQPEVSLGVPPGFGGTQRLLRAVGRARALELITTGRQVKAAEALAMGLVNQVVEGAELQATGLAQARSIAKQGPLAVRLAKQVIHQGQDMALAQACALETKAFAMCFASADQREGMAAFLARRPAQFSGE
jgi:enoyl-CoA hydratase